MQTLSRKNLEQRLSGSETIEQDGHGLKVVRLADGDFLKLFRRKRLLSSALWSPPAQRFADNVAALHKKGITAPTITGVFRIPELRLWAVQYTPLPGQTLRETLRSASAAARMQAIEALGAYLGLLHEKGIYFRSVHLGNVLVLPDGSFGLIDLADLKTSTQPLKAALRRRNMTHLTRYAEDRRWLVDTHLDALIKGYAQVCGQKFTHAVSAALSRIATQHAHPAEQA